MKRFSRLLLVPIVVTACSSIDQLLEEPADPESYLRFGWPSLALTIPKGDEHTLTITITRRDGYSKGVTVTVLGLPPGVTSSVAASSAGDVITALVTVRVAGTVQPGDYQYTLRVRGETLRDLDRPGVVHVIEPPAYSIATSSAEVRVVSGGIAPVTVNVARTNFSDPVTLSADQVPGVSVAFQPNPVTANQADVLLSIAPDIAPGTYAVTIRGVTAALADRTVPLSVIVTTDHIQVIADSVVTALQGATTRETIIVNHTASAGSVAISAENLPSGVTVTFEPSAQYQHVMTLAIPPATPVGSYSVTIRATGTGVPDATAQLRLEIKHSGIALTLAPESLSVFQGRTDSAKLTIQRTSLDTSVAIALENVPAGVTATATPANTTGTSAWVKLAVPSTLTPGLYELNVVATPAGWPPDASTRVPLRLNVRELVASSGNVVVDWSSCTSPVWFAAQDGVAPWQQIQSVAGVYQFNINSSKGGFAYVSGDSLVLRYLTQSELTAKAIGMCPPAPATKRVTGTGVHVSSTEQSRYNFGGGTAFSTAANPEFTITGVRPGVHDLVAWGSSSFALRGVIRRDQDIEDGGTLGAVDMSLAEAFVPVGPNLTLAGSLAANETVAHSMSFLTTDACTVNPLYTTANTARTTPMFGVPDALRRASDFHLLTVTASLGSRTRTMTLAFQRMELRTVSFDAAVATPSVVSLGGRYKRLQAFVPNVSASYNGSAELRYTGAGKVASVKASRAWIASTNVLIAVPDLSPVSGWMDAFAPLVDSNGPWTFTLDGGVGATPCSLTFRSISSRHMGTF